MSAPESRSGFHFTTVVPCGIGRARRHPSRSEIYAYRLADPGRSRRSARRSDSRRTRGIAGAGSPGYAVGPGTAIVVDGSAACTLAVAGYDKAGRLIGLTAGHCGNVGSKVAWRAAGPASWA